MSPPPTFEAASPRLSYVEVERLEEAAHFPKRPTPGTKGKGITLIANYLEVPSLPVGEIVQYDVSINPDVPRALRRSIFDVVDRNYRNSAFGGKMTAYDGMANLFSFGPLPKEQCALEIQLEGRPGREPRKFVFSIRRVSIVNLAVLQQFLQGKLGYTPYEVINSLEVILRNPLVATGVVVGRSVYSSKGPNKPKLISGGLEVWSGFFHSLRAATGRLLLNLDISNTAFYAPGPVLDSVGDICQQQNIPQVLNPSQRNSLERLLRGVKIEVTHRGEGFKKKSKVLGLGGSADEITFNDHEGRATNVTKYFSEKYNIKLAFPQLPCLVIGSNEKQSFVPIEVCKIPDGQRYIRKLNEVQTADMIKIANSKPEERLRMIQSGIGLLNEHRAYYDNFKMAFGNQLVQVQGRVINPPTIFYGRNSSIQPMQGTWNMRDKAVEKGAALESWAVVIASSRANIQEIQRFVAELINSCSDMGLNFGNTRNPPIISAMPDLGATLKKAAAAAQDMYKAPPQFLLVILMSTDSQVYGDIKRVGDTEMGIPTQCMQIKHTRNPNKQYCANLGLKINLKLGGSNLNLGNQLSLLESQPTIVFGADVTHPGIGEGDKPSIAAVVASMDRHLSRYAANVRVQGGRKEIIEDLKSMVKEHLINFRASTTFPPGRIIFYRDGVGEGQFAQVTQQEVNAIKEACHELSPSYNPAIMFILVQKRHHTRFFVANRGDADRSGNIPAGTCVDSPNILNPNLYEFFLCSHAGLQGTSRPTRYVVVHDDVKSSADELQVFTHSLCHTFARCTRSVSIATPAYYAHLVAFRARFHFKQGMPHSPHTFQNVVPELAKKMYFI